MKPVFAAHPHLTDGATTIDPKGNVVPAGLYLDGNGPHPINSFGCTICHGGQGSGDRLHLRLARAQRPEAEGGVGGTKYHWHEIHHWDEPMLPRRFIESSCLKCHHQVTDVPQAKKLQAGYERIVKYGCTGCHTIGGEGSFGPDLTDERQVGPNLAHLGVEGLEGLGPQVDQEPARLPARHPDAPVLRRDQQRRARRPAQDRRRDPRDHPLPVRQEHPARRLRRTRPPRATRRRARSSSSRRAAWPATRTGPTQPAEVQLADRDDVNPDYKPDAAATYDPSGFPESVRQYARADYGPNLSNIAAKFQSHDAGLQVAGQLDQGARGVPPQEPDAQPAALGRRTPPTSPPGSSRSRASGPVELARRGRSPTSTPREVKEAIDELVRLYVEKGGITRNGKHDRRAAERGRRLRRQGAVAGREADVPGREDDQPARLLRLPHITGFENAKPIGTPLNGWGIKSPTKLDFAHITEYLEDQASDDKGFRDGTSPYYQEKLEDHTRIGFLYQKLHRPRSYDYRKTNEDLKTWDDRLRMPQFAWANDPAAVEEVMTFVLGLTGEKITSRYLPKTHYNADPDGRRPGGEAPEPVQLHRAATSWRCPDTRSPRGPSWTRR